jgi:hypothetical protein
MAQTGEDAMTDFRDDEYRDVEVQRDESGMIIMPSERKTEPPPKTGGMAGLIFVAIVTVAGVGGYFLMANAPPAEEYALEQTDAPQLYVTPQPQQLAMSETPTAAPVTPAPVQRQAAPRSASPPMDTPMPDVVPPIATVDPIAPPPMDLNTPPTGE